MNLLELESYFKGMISTNDRKYEEYILSYLKDHNVLISLLNNILKDEESLDLVAANSFKHPLGFIRIVLIDYKKFRYMLRLHIWNYSSQTNIFSDHHIHNHWCDFYSVLLSGELSFAIYSESREGLLYYKYENPIEDNTYLYDFVNAVNLEKQIDVSLTRGSSYFISQSALHLVTAKTDNLTSTLVLQLPNTVGKSVVYTSSPIYYKQREVPDKFTLPELESILKNYIISLSGL
ncbi:hypothetical protein [Spirosoma sp.]|uniref:hypothetical protein n=1 Tax=Spirosoma sp. TaxID=1899569 RepID=UPI003B3A0826